MYKHYHKLTYIIKIILLINFQEVLVITYCLLEGDKRILKNVPFKN